MARCFAIFGAYFDGVVVVFIVSTVIFRGSSSVIGFTCVRVCIHL